MDEANRLVGDGTGFRVVPMTREYALIMRSWEYEPPYTFYNNVNADIETWIEELLDGSYYAALNDDGHLAGHYAYGPNATLPAGHSVGAYDMPALDIGLGLRPDLTGHGLGLAFTCGCLEYARAQLDPVAFRLSVVEWNQRAIRTYERVGFTRETSFRRSHGKDEVVFLVMTRER